MPNLKFEYSANLKEQIDPHRLFAPCHHILVETLGAELFRCKSRAFRHELFYIGDGSSIEAFIYVEIVVKEGRSLAILQEAGKQILKFLELYFAGSLKELNLQIGVSMLENPSGRYFTLESRK